MCMILVSAFSFFGARMQVLIWKLAVSRRLGFKLEMPKRPFSLNDNLTALYCVKLTKKSRFDFFFVPMLLAGPK